MLMMLLSFSGNGQNLIVTEKGDTMAQVSIESIRKANLVFVELKEEKAKAARIEKVITDLQTSVHYYQKAAEKSDSIVVLKDKVIVNEQEKYGILEEQLYDAKKEAKRARWVAAAGVLLGVMFLIL
jgi:hypothetical protein